MSDDEVWVDFADGLGGLDAACVAEGWECGVESGQCGFEVAVRDRMAFEGALIYE